MSGNKKVSLKAFRFFEVGKWFGLKALSDFFQEQREIEIS